MIKIVSRAGFTLIEVLVYLGIFMVVSTGTIMLLISLDTIIDQYQVDTALYRSGTNVLEQVVAEVRQADQFDAGSSVVNDSTLGKLVVHNGGVTTEFVRSGTSLERIVDGVSLGTMLSEGVSVTEFTVYTYDTAIGVFVRVRLGLSATIGGTTKTITLYDGAIIRGDL